jgi:hypothetical protein
MTTYLAYSTSDRLLEILQAGAFGYTGGSGEEGEGSDEILTPGSEEPEEERTVPWRNRPLWNICGCCDDAVRHPDWSPLRCDTLCRISE